MKNQNQKQRASKLPEDLKERENLLVKIGLWPPLRTLDKAVFEKTDSEKELLKTLKAKNKEDVRKLGFNPKTRLNTWNPIILKI